jgi:hypothetical protein
VVLMPVADLKCQGPREKSPTRSMVETDLSLVNGPGLPAMGCEKAPAEL